MSRRNSTDRNTGNSSESEEQVVMRNPHRLETGASDDVNRESTVTPVANGHLQRKSTSDISYQTWDEKQKKYINYGQNGYLERPLSDEDLTINGICIPCEAFSGINIQESPVEKSNGDFAGRRDVTSPETLLEKQIVSRKGSIRGFKNRVRAGIATFLQQQEERSRDYRQLEKGKIVIYTTSMSVVRNTSERCKIVRKILHNHMVRYDERDLFMSRENQKELLERLGATQVVLPQVFADGIHLGGAKEIEALNESGEFRTLLKHFTRISVRSSCEKCGGYRYIPCTSCHGSKKSLLRNHFTEEFCALRCMQCDENGLVRCDLCIDQQE